MLAVMRLSPNPVLKSTAWVYLWIFRGTPVYVQLVFWGLFTSIYRQVDIGIPFAVRLADFNLQGIDAAFTFAVIGLGLNEAAYMAEIVRAGISSVGEGQTEASVALGMTWSQTMRRTVLPQAMRVIIPPTGNEVISMLKTTSLVAAVPLTTDLYVDGTGHLGRELPADPAAAGGRDLVSGRSPAILMVGQYFLEKRFARGSSRTLTNRQLQALADAQVQSNGIAGRSDERNRAPRTAPIARWCTRSSVRKNFGALKVLQAASRSTSTAARCCAWSARRVRASRRSCAASTTWRR